MASGNGKIYIVIKEEKQATSGESVGAEQTDIQEVESKQSENGVSPLQSYAINQAAGFLKNTAQQYMNHYVSTYGVRTGDYIRQTNIQYVINAINTVGSVLNSGLTGASIGAAGGPIGAVIGAAIGLTVGIAKIGFDAYLNYQDTTRQAAITNTQLAMTRTRLGIDIYNDGGRGTEN